MTKLVSEYNNMEKVCVQKLITALPLNHIVHRFMVRQNYLPFFLATQDGQNRGEGGVIRSLI